MSSRLHSRLRKLEEKLLQEVQCTGCLSCARSRPDHWPLIFRLEGDQEPVPICPACGEVQALVFNIVRVHPSSAA